MIANWQYLLKGLLRDDHQAPTVWRWRAGQARRVNKEGYLAVRHIERDVVAYMTDSQPVGPPRQVEARSVQHYIDERPTWADGTIAPSVPLTSMQWRIWWLAAAGKFFVGFVIFVTGVALPLICRE